MVQDLLNMNNMMHQITQKGVSAIEVLVGVSIAGIMLVSSFFAITTFLNASHVLSEKTQAVYLAEEGLELVRFVRDNDWLDISSLTLNTPYYLEITEDEVLVSGTPEVIGDFTRSFVVQNVHRNNATNAIVESTTSGAVPDPNTKYVTVTITWGTPLESVSLTTILANLEP